MESPERLRPKNTRPHDARPSAEVAEELEEARNLRRLKWMIGMVLSAIYQDPNLMVEQASELVANAKNATLGMLPWKELVAALLCKPRLQRAMRALFSLR